MSGAVLLWIVTVLYAGQIVVALCKGLPAHAVIVGGYVIANPGLIWSLSR